MLRRGALVAAVLAVLTGCVRAPSRIDHAALVATHGPVEARRTLELRILRDPSDLAARLALAALSEQLGRPSAAIEQLEAVVRIGGPLGTRWRDDDRARLARLIASRGLARLARSSPTSLADLTRARSLGASIDERSLALARRARALSQLRHVDAKERAVGHQLLRSLIQTPAADATWTAWATEPRLGPQRGAYGAWLWAAGARRAAWEELEAWHASGPRDPSLQSAYLIARAWWVPDDAPPPPPADLVGPERCRFPTAVCDPRALLDSDPTALPGLLAASTPRATTAPQATAWLELTLRQALRGEARWGAAFAARVNASALPVRSLPPAARLAYARLTGRTDPLATAASLATEPGLLAAAGLALTGAPPAFVRTALGPLSDTPDGRALLRIVEDPTAPASVPLAPPAPSSAPTAHTAAVVASVRARVPDAPPAATLERLVTAYARDPAITDRLLLDAVATAPDAAAAHAALGALFEALADPARSRAAWQAAVDESPEPAYVRGLAEAAARAKDPDAALVHATAAAAAAGDPAPIWISLSLLLSAVGSDIHALEAARYAIELAGADAIAPALDAAITASRALGRPEQVAALSSRRATVGPPPPRSLDADPTDPVPALAAHRSRPSAATLAALWIASRWNPRDVSLRAALRASLSATDPRRPTLDAELLTLAADPDPALSLSAVAALR